MMRPNGTDRYYQLMSVNLGQRGTNKPPLLEYFTVIRQSRCVSWFSTAQYHTPMTRSVLFWLARCLLSRRRASKYWSLPEQEARKKTKEAKEAKEGPGIWESNAPPSLMIRRGRFFFSSSWQQCVFFTASSRLMCSYRLQVRAEGLRERGSIR